MPAPRSIVVLTGAGVSAESGLPTFRGAGGLWRNHRAQDLATPEAFAAAPALVQRFYNERRRQLLGDAVRPNPAHHALARLEREFAGDLLIVTQNIDDLHERAGSRALLHLHGELLKMRCTHSGRLFEVGGDIAPDQRCACCDAPRRLRPHVVWFGEQPLGMQQAYAALAGCDLFIAAGTSGNVYPAAGFGSLAREAGARTVELNLEPSAVGSDFLERRYGPASELVPAYVDELLAQR